MYLRLEKAINALLESISDMVRSLARCPGKTSGVTLTFPTEEELPLVALLVLDEISTSSSLQDAKKKRDKRNGKKRLQHMGPN